MKKRLVSFFLVMVIVFSFGTSVFADIPYIEPFSTPINPPVTCE